MAPRHVIRRLLLYVVLAAVLAAGSPLGIPVTGALSADEPLPRLSVYFFDVGQGDATLFLGHDFTILVDAGRHDQNEVVPLLRSVGVQSIDLFIGTHPHSDHIGQCEDVLSQFPVREVWLSGDIHTSRTFERCLDAILASDAGYHEPRAGETFQFGSARIEIVHPAEVTGDFNNGSVGFRLLYGDVAFLLTGDAEAEAEQSMLERGHDLKAHVLHVGHHGSRTSSTVSFLEAVEPEVAIYSAGQDNPYGHPHPEVVQRYAWLGIPLYGTDVYGTIRILTDGRSYEIYTERDGTAAIAPSIPDMCRPGQVNINAADVSELTRIVHVGAVVAERIISARPFFSLDELTRVSGIGAARLAAIVEQGLACIGPLH